MREINPVYPLYCPAQGAEGIVLALDEGFIADLAGGGQLDGASASDSGFVGVNSPFTTQVLIDSFDTEDWDTGSYWSAGSPAKMTVAKTGYYLVSAAVNVRIDGHTGFAATTLTLKKNTYTTVRERFIAQYNDGVNAYVEDSIELNCTALLTASDFVELYAVSTLYTGSTGAADPLYVPYQWQIRYLGN